MERVIIYCLRGEEVGVWRDLLFPQHILLKKQTTYRSLTRQVSVEGKNLQKSKFPRLIFFQNKDYVMYQIIAHLFCSRFRQVSFLGGNKLPKLVSINFLVFPSIPLSRFTCKWWNMVSFHFHGKIVQNDNLKSRREIPAFKGWSEFYIQQLENFFN